MKINRKSKIKAFALLALLALCLSLFGCMAREREVSESFIVMSTVAVLKLTGPDCEEAAEEIKALLYSFEDRTSRYIEGSDIYEINSHAGVAECEISYDSYALLKKAKGYFEESGGLFDVTIGPIVSLWGIGGDDARVPSASELKEAVALIDIASLALREEGGRYYASLEREGQSLDLGGLAKGYALDLCREALTRYNISGGTLSLGGNVLLFGDKGGKGFTVGVKYPEEGTNAALCVLKLSDTVVATTGGYERYFEAEGLRYSHVLDPKTGFPAETDIASASVVCSEGCRSDYLSTRLYMLGIEGAVEAMRTEGIEAVILGENNRLYISSSLEDSFIISSLDENYSYEFV